VVRVAAVGLLVVLALGTLGSSFAWSLALSEECRRLERVDLSIEEMVDLKQKVDDAVREGRNDVVLSGDETSFVLREFLRLPVYVQVEAGEVLMQAAVPRNDQCYNIDYRGAFTIAEGSAHLRPRILTIGELELADWVGEELALAPERVLDDPETLDLFAHLQRVEVDGDEVVVEVDDLEALR